MSEMSGKEAKELANYVRGFADGTQNEKLFKVGNYLDTLSQNMCAGGFICNGGENCTSSHK